MLHHAKSRAKKLSLEFSITEDDIRIPNFCPALGIRLKVGDGTIHDGSPTLDRLDPSQGYTPGNVAVVSNLANRIKTNASSDQVRLLADWMDNQR